MNVPEEDPIIQRARHGDPEAFDSLVTAYYPAILNYCYRMLSNRADAEDVTQETFIQAAAKIRQLQCSNAFRAWLYRIASSRSRDLQRKRIRLERREDGYYQYSRLVGEQETANGVIGRYVAMLPLKLKEAVVLVYWEDMSHATAAETLECAESTVSWRLHEAKKQLKSLMKASCESDRT